MNQETEVIFLGTSGCTPDLENDTASILINQKYLVDTGWSIVANLREKGIEPTEITHLFFTHMHHDHYMSLPSLLFYYLCKEKSLNRLKIIGPQRDVERVVKLAYDFLQVDRFYKNAGYPSVIPLKPGEGYHEEEFELTTCPSLHPVQGLCYRFTDRKTGKVIGITGDTAYYPPIVKQMKNSDLLIHEASLGPCTADPVGNKQYLHSGSEDAGRVAAEAQVGKLFMVHGTTSRGEACVQAAAKYFQKEIRWPEIGVRYIL